MRLAKRIFIGVTLLAFIWLGFAGCAGNSAKKKDAELALAPDQFVVMTFNLRYDNPDDGPNAWPKRTDIVAQTIQEANPDIMGVQEGLAHQIDWLASTFPQYTVYGVGREGGRKGEHMSIFVRKDRFRIDKQGEFWLSEKPDVPGLKGWDAACPRMVTWLKLYDRMTKREFVAVNTHLDHRGNDAKKFGAKMIVEFVNALPDNLPVVVTGDFNSYPKGLVHGILCGQQPISGGRSKLRDTFYDIDWEAQQEKKADGEPPWTIEPGSSHGWTGVIKPGGRIDWILVSPEFQALSLTIDDKSYDGRFPSDHLPVYARIQYR